MRASAIFRLITVTVLVAGAVLWYRERAVAAKLAERLAALQQQAETVSRLRAERESLRDQLMATGSKTGPVSVITGEREGSPVATPEARAKFVVGEWTAVSAWQNEGRSTPLATMATFLWAAAGGDQATLLSALVFDDATRAKALALFNALPPATRSLYATPEELVASVTMKNIPLTAAQISWFHQADAEHATVGVMMTAPKTAVVISDEIMEAPEPNAPPRLANANPNPLAVLNLRRSADGWRVVVPAAAIDRIAAELRAPQAD